MKRTLLVFLVLAVSGLNADEPLPSPPAGEISRAQMEQEAGMSFPDMFASGTSPYAALKRAAEAAGSTSWLMPRLNDGRPVPQASARDLAMELLENDNVSADLKEDLRREFPSETKQFKDHRPANLAELEKLQPRIEAMEKRLDLITETMLKNVYDKGSFPSASVSFNTGYRDGAGHGLYLGHDATHFASIQADIKGTLPDGAFAVTMGGHFDSPYPYGGNRTIIGISGASLSLGNYQVRFGERDSFNFSSLVYAGMSIPESSLFHNSNSDVPTLGLAPVGVGPASELWDFRRLGQPTWWWPFNDAHILFSPHNQFYETWQSLKLYDMAGRLDLSPFQFGPVSDLKPYFSWVNTYTDRAQLEGAGFANALTQSNHAYALGFDMALENGSTVLLEGGYSDFTRSDLVEGFQDTAVYALATLPLGDLTLALEGSQIGPRFLAGGNDARLSANGQAGAFLDTLMDDFERQGGRRGTFSYQSNIREPQGMTNNSRRLALKAELKTFWLTLGLHYAYSEQIEPSGPWIQSHFILTGKDYNGAGLFYRFGQSYATLGRALTAPPGGELNNQYAFAKPTLARAYYKNHAFNTPVYWHELSQLIYHETQTFILLSQQGVDDANTREDSRKTLNALKTTMAADFKPLFNRDLHSDLVLSNEIRDLSEGGGLAMLTDEHLLGQMSSDVTLRWGLSQDVDFRAILGYETWLTEQSLFPVRWAVRYGGVGMDFKMDEVLSGMWLYVNADRYEFDDSYFGERSYKAWSWSIGTGVNY